MTKQKKNEKISIGTGDGRRDLILGSKPASRVYAIVARRGAGKTYAAGVLTEKIYRAGYQVVVLDPVGNWWAMRLAADGRSPGLDVPVLGGMHGDVELSPDAGSLMADVAGDGHSLILDLSGFDSEAAMHRFVAAFCKRLYVRKQRRRSPLLLVLEEADEFAPQTQENATQAPMLGAVKRLALRGRNFGVGLAAVTLAPQLLHKRVLNQADFFMAGQTIGFEERKRIGAWVKETGQERETLAGDLPSLPVGEFVVWSPWLRTYGRYKIAEKTTFDSSRTPDEEVADVQLPALDVAALGEKMASIVKERRANDPAALHRRIAELEKQLAAPARDPEVDARALEEAAARARHDALMEFASRVEGAVRDVTGVLSGLVADVNGMVSQAPAPPVPMPKGANVASSGRASAEAWVRPRDGTKVDVIARTLAARAATGHPDLTVRQLARLVGYSPRTKVFLNYLGTMRAEGLAESPARGVLRAGPNCPGVDSGPAHRWAMWEPVLDPKEVEVINAVAAYAGRGATTADLADALGYSPRTKVFLNRLGALTSLGLLSRPGRGVYDLGPEADWFGL